MFLDSAERFSVWGFWKGWSGVFFQTVELRSVSLFCHAAPMAAGYETRHLYTTTFVDSVVGTMGGFNISQTDP